MAKGKKAPVQTVATGGSRIDKAVRAFGSFVKERGLSGTKADYGAFRAAVGASPPDHDELVMHFGSWSAVRRAAGLTPASGPKAKGDLLDVDRSMARFRKETNHRARRVDYEAWARQTPGVLSAAQMRRILGTDWWNKATTRGEMAMTRVRRVEPGPELEAQVRLICDGEALSEREYDACRRQRFPNQTLASAGVIALAYGTRRKDGRRRADWHRALRAAGVL